MCELCRATDTALEQANGENQAVIEYIMDKFHAEHALEIWSLTPWVKPPKVEDISVFQRQQELEDRITGSQELQALQINLEDSLKLEHDAMMEYISGHRARKKSKSNV
ncbi:MAG: hypothetical protein V1808_03185 [Candidatus Daviesbacteria bacterium]